MADAGDQVRGRLMDDVHHPFPSGGGWLQGFLGSFGGLLLLLLLLGLEEEGFLLLLLLLGLEEEGVLLLLLLLLLGLEEESFLLLLLLLLLGLLEEEGFLLLLLLLGLEEEELLVELLLLLGLVLLLLVLQGVGGGAWWSWLDRRSRLHFLDDLDGW